jgi:hypothetical protein
MRTIIIPLSLLLMICGAPGAARSRAVNLDEALESARANNVTWEALGQYARMAKAARRIGLGLYLPKVSAQAQWLHMGERNAPDLGGLDDMGALLGTMAGTIVERHPDTMERFLPYLSATEDDDGGGFDSFVPKQDTLAATFNVLVPVVNLAAVTVMRATEVRHDAALQRIGHGRERLLYAVARAYHGLLTLQTMRQVNARSAEAARAHFDHSRVRRDLQAGTELEMKRAELEVRASEAQGLQLEAGFGQALASFGYLTGLQGRFDVVAPPPVSVPAERGLSDWLALAREARKDLIAARLEILATEHEVDQTRTRYLPTLDLFAQAKLDNNQDQRFDDDPLSWTAGATLNMTLYDGGIREAELDMARSKRLSAELTVRDLEARITSEVQAAFGAVADARAARRMAESQLEVAQATQALAVASEKAGAATPLQVIDANTMVAASESQLVTARLAEDTAILDLLAASGQPLPY